MRHGPVLMRQWVLSFPYSLRILFASRPAIMGRVLGIVYRVIATHLVRQGGFTRKTARTVADCREAVGHMDVPDKTCRACGGAIKVIACIEDPQVIEKILTDLDQKPAATARNPLPRSRAPPPPGLFGRH